jgi:N-acetylmuramoyl-L-alanine amidase
MRYLICSLGILASLWTSSCHTTSQASPPAITDVVEVVPDEWLLRQRLEWLLHDEGLHDLIEIDSTGISLYASSQDRQAQRPEVKIYPEEYLLTARLYEMMRPDSMVRYYQEKGTQAWDDSWQALARHALPMLPGPITLAGELPLTGWRIALDPGHIAGDMKTAEIEGKYIRMHPSQATNFDRIAFWEANLTLATGHLIRQQLDSLGATVMMTRYTTGVDVNGLSYPEWKQQHWPQAAYDSAVSWKLTQRQLAFWLQKADDKAIMRSFYTAEDLRNRANRINAFRPHLTLIIHYNVHGPNWEQFDRAGFIPPGDTNYSMAFIPGSFLNRELETVEDRAILLRLLLTMDMTYSQELAEAFITASEQLTEVPPVPVNHQLGYLHNSSRYTGSPGVYARNLSLTRLIRGPLVYGESLNQDYLGEALRLNQRDRMVEGVPVSSRVQTVADAYVAAVLAFAQDRHF